MLEVGLKSAAAGGGKPVLGARNAGFEELVATDVVRFFEFSGVNAEVAVGRFQQAAQVVEAERVIDGEGAHDTQPQALVNDAIEFGQIVEDTLARARL